MLLDDRADLLVLTEARGDEGGRRRSGCQQAIGPLRARVDEGWLHSLLTHVSRPNRANLFGAGGAREQTMRVAAVLHAEAVR